MAIQDRTDEFRACVEAIKHRTVTPLQSRDAEAKQRLINQRKNESNKTEFAQMSNSIRDEIVSTNAKLDKLGQRAYPLHFLVQVAYTEEII